MGEAVGPQRSKEWSNWRTRCDISSSDAANACGIGYDSRMLWLGVRLGERVKPEDDDVTKEILERGQEDQPFAQYEYARSVLSKQHGLLPEWHYRRAVHSRDSVYIFGATPDAIVAELKTRKIVRLVEYKSIQRGTTLPNVPRPAHLLQTVLQMFCTGVSETHLFYYCRITGQYRCFLVTSDDTRFEGIVWPWLREALEMRSVAQARMPKGEKQRRENMLLVNFYNH